MVDTIVCAAVWAVCALIVFSAMLASEALGSVLSTVGLALVATSCVVLLILGFLR